MENIHLKRSISNDGKFRTICVILPIRPNHTKCINQVVSFMYGFNHMRNMLNGGFALDAFRNMQLPFIANILRSFWFMAQTCNQQISDEILFACVPLIMHKVVLLPGIASTYPHLCLEKYHLVLCENAVLAHYRVSPREKMYQIHGIISCHSSNHVWSY